MRRAEASDSVPAIADVEYDLEESDDGRDYINEEAVKLRILRLLQLIRQQVWELEERNVSNNNNVQQAPLTMVMRRQHAYDQQIPASFTFWGEPAPVVVTGVNVRRELITRLREIDRRVEDQFALYTFPRNPMTGAWISPTALVLGGPPFFVRENFRMVVQTLEITIERMRAFNDLVKDFPDLRRSTDCLLLEFRQWMILGGILESRRDRTRDSVRRLFRGIANARRILCSPLARFANTPLALEPITYPPYYACVRVFLDEVVQQELQRPLSPDTIILIVLQRMVQRLERYMRVLVNNANWIMYGISNGTRTVTGRLSSGIDTPANVALLTPLIGTFSDNQQPPYPFCGRATEDLPPPRDRETGRSFGLGPWYPL